MIDDTLQKLEERIRASKRTGEETREELLSLVAELRGELTAAAETHGAQAASVARHAEAVAAGAADTGTAEEIEDTLLAFESQHPRLVGLVQRFFRTLSDGGL